LREEAEGFLAGRADALRARGADPVDTRAIGSYSAGHGLHRLARDAGGGVIVLGPSRRRRAGRNFAGPMGSRLAHDAPCSVAVAPDGYEGGAFAKLGVGYAATPDGENALRAAAALALRAGASLLAIAVAAPLPWLDIVEPEFDGVMLQNAYHGHVAHALERAVGELPDRPAIESRIVAGDPVEVLTGATDELDLLVCGSRGHGTLGTVLLGSISHDLLATARCPVLVVPRSGAQTREIQSRCFAA
jgi:nucleotide-binding universal stress UspA family protein